MGKTLLNNKIVCLIPVLLLFVLSGWSFIPKKEPALGPFSYCNPEGDIFAVLVGSRMKGANRWAIGNTRPVLLRLDEKSYLKSYRKLKDYVWRDMAWRPAHDNQLYYVVFEDVYGEGGTLPGRFGRRYKLANGKLVSVDANSDKNPARTITQKDRPNILSYFKWSPDGKTLAGIVSNPAGRMISQGELGFSFDGGKTCKSTGINIGVWPTWLNDNELLARTDNNTIVRLSRDGQEFKIAETIAKDFSVWVEGIFQERLVYTAGPRKDPTGKSLNKLTRLFVGDQLIYETNRPSFRCYVCKDRIVYEADGKVIAMDEKLSVCHEMPLGEKTQLFNFSPKTNIVFLVKDWKTILCYDYTKNEKPHVLFSVAMQN